jgi:hypothetical protein
MRLESSQRFAQARRDSGMKKPTLRVTQWLADIPVEASCTFCNGVSFRAQTSSHRPNRQEYQKSLESQFDEHCKRVHTPEK